MTFSLSLDTQATLLLTAPLIAGDVADNVNTLRPSEYVKLTNALAKSNHTPAHLLESNLEHLSTEVRAVIDDERYRQLLSRGFQLTQAQERWQSRAIWIVGHNDDAYPARFKDRLKDHSPPLIYGCGDAAILETGGLAVVGSRDVDPTLVEFTENVGRLAAQARRTVVSGAARGIDQAAMRGALEAGGKVVGVMADSLERAAAHREHRDLISDSKLVLISPYDPLAGFNIGHAMQRNKLIYALSDAALVVNSDYEKGGTWAGAVEQLEKYRFVPVYVRTCGDVGQGLEALQRKGALPWTNPTSSDDFEELLDNAAQVKQTSSSEQLSFL
jgi:DNA processing protein